MTRDAMIEKWDNYRLRYPDAWSRERAVIDEFLADLAALSRPAPPDDIVAKLASIEWAGSGDGDGIASCPACQRRRFYHDDRRNHRADCWLAAALAAPAPVAAPAPETPAAEPECAGPFVSAFDCPKCDPRRRKPSPETPAPDAMPEIRGGDLLAAALSSLSRELQLKTAECEDNRDLASRHNDDSGRKSLEVADLRDEVTRLSRDLETARQHIKACEAMIREHAEAAAIFQPGGRLHARANLILGRSSVVEGIAWLVAQLDQTDAAVRAARAETWAEAIKIVAEWDGDLARRLYVAAAREGQ